MSGTLHSIDTCHTEAAHKFLIKKDLSGTNKRQALLLYPIYYGLVQVQRGYIFFSHMMRVQKATEKNLHRAFNQGAAILRAGHIEIVYPGSSLGHALSEKEMEPLSLLPFDH